MADGHSRTRPSFLVMPRPPSRPRGGWRELDADPRCSCGIHTKNSRASVGGSLGADTAELPGDPGPRTWRHDEREK